jgi:hypothetical protein
MSTSTHQRDEHHTRSRHGAHRARRSVLGAVMPSVLAVAAVASLITALAVWQGQEPDQPRATAAASADGAEPAAEPTTDAAPEPSAAATEAPSEQPSEPPQSPETSVEGTKAAVADLEVVVLNQTTRSGLAASVAEQLRGSGWEVPAVGNFRGVVPATTVYYPDGGEAAALAVAGDLPTEPRVRPRFGNLSTRRLTVVVTDSYPS